MPPAFNSLPATPALGRHAARSTRQISTFAAPKARRVGLSQPLAVAGNVPLPARRELSPMPRPASQPVAKGKPTRLAALRHEGHQPVSKAAGARPRRAIQQVIGANQVSKTREKTVPAGRSPRDKKVRGK